MSVLAGCAAAAVLLLGGAPAAEFGTSGHSQPQATVLETARSAGGFETLLSALETSGLMEELSGEGPFTVFAPTDEAFQALGDETLQALMAEENREALRSVLKYHVVAGTLMSEDVASRNSAATLNEQRLNFLNEGGVQMVDQAGIVRADIDATNGVIHVVDAVLRPNLMTTAQTMRAAPSFETFMLALQTAGLEEVLSGSGPFTVFAPTDEAFRQLPDGTLQNLLRPENREELTRILNYHIVPNRVYAKLAVVTERGRTRSGGLLRFDIEAGRFTVNGVDVVMSDIDAANGVVHVIDGVLLPED